MKKLMLGLLMAFAVTAEAAVVSHVNIGDLLYDLDTEAKTATITGCVEPPTAVEISTVEKWDETFTVTSVGAAAFKDCTSLTTVSLPNVTTVGERAFDTGRDIASISLPAATEIGCNAFGYMAYPSYLTLNWRFKANWATKMQEIGVRGAWELIFVGQPSQTAEEIKQARWKYEAMSLDVGGETMDEAEYRCVCGFYEIAPQEKIDDPQVVQEGEVAVKQTELQAAKAEAVTVADGVVSLGVTVNTNGNFTAEAKSWKPVELKPENVVVKDGKIVISIPVSDKSGFMILQSGDAKIPPAN